jgi:hypothetical protein
LADLLKNAGIGIWPKTQVAWSSFVRELSNFIEAAHSTISAAYIAADVVVTNAFVAADAVVTTAFATADAVVTTAFGAADAVVTTAFGAADTAHVATKHLSAYGYISGDSTQNGSTSWGGIEDAGISHLSQLVTNDPTAGDWKMTVTNAGIYRITVQGWFEYVSTTLTFLNVGIGVNGSDPSGNRYVMGKVTSVLTHIPFSCSIMLSLSADDYVQAMAKSAHATNDYILFNVNFTISRVDY